MAIKYPPLGANIRQDLQASFLAKATTTNRVRFSCKDLKELA